MARPDLGDAIRICAPTKPRLLPVTVPWQIDPGAPYLTLQFSPAGQPLSATFIGYFKCDEPLTSSLPYSAMQVISEPPPFQPRSLDQKAPLRLVRVHFREGHAGRVMRAFADEVVREADYDWSAVTASPRPGESIHETLRRIDDLWRLTGMCPNPCMYEVQGSPWLAQLDLPEPPLRHYLLLGHDEYVEVIAQGWTWEAGQAIE